MTDPAPLTPANEPDPTPVYEHWGHGPGGTAPHSAALTDEELAEMDTAFRRSGRYPDLRAYGLRLIAALRADRAVADDLAIALHHCSNYLPLFLSEHDEEGRKLQRAIAVNNQVQIAMSAYCKLTGTRRPDLTDRTVTPKDVHD